MTINEYLNLVLNTQKLTDDQKVQLVNNRDQIEDLLRDEFEESLFIQFAGSKAKGTMIREKYDADIVCYFPEECDISLKDIYDDVYDKLSTQYFVEKKASALRISTRNDNESIDLHIDVVPGKFSDSNTGDAFLYKSTGEKERLKTNIKLHISHVVKSGFRKEIKLIKLWNVRNNLGIKTFALELLVIKILKKCDKKSLEERMIYFWEELKDNMDNLAIEDPANPNGNDLSNIFNVSIKGKLKQSSSAALNRIDSGGWETIFGSVDTLEQDLETNKDKFLLESFSHREKLIDKNIKIKLNKSYWVRVDAGLYFGLAKHPIVNRRFLNSFLRGSFLPKFHWLKYRATTNVPMPYDLYWQVVNTGIEAKEAQESGRNGLRGEIFINNSDRWERSEYQGKHWIEAFVVVNNECVARSGPFFVVF